MNEKQLQSKMVVAFSQAYPEQRGRLFATFQETLNAIQGSNRLSLGLIKGVSDLLYVTDKGELIGIEVKCSHSRHKASHVIEQANWLLKVPKKGYFCTSVEMLMDIVNGGEGISPQYILDNIKGKSFVF